MTRQQLLPILQNLDWKQDWIDKIKTLIYSELVDKTPKTFHIIQNVDWKQDWIVKTILFKT